MKPNVFLNEFRVWILNKSAKSNKIKCGVDKERKWGTEP